MTDREELFEPMNPHKFMTHILWYLMAHKVHEVERKKAIQHVIRAMVLVEEHEPREASK